ncbi:palmitoyltransferase ZDHHC11 isoform X2 [Genypterus blacodes]|uniref:palmitoyltransferase ZDHHC11 isoform X2 n=1 Tax=Genypterus blacodes TaxID=154954 RepID=UPI003F7678C2
MYRILPATMSCFSKRLRRTAPMRGSSRNELVPSKPPRINGWSWPPQAFQVVAWIVFAYFGVVIFGIYIPLIPLPWNHVAYGLTGVLFAVHLVTHIAAVSIDPADDNVRAKHNYSSPMPRFDRKEQPHVIQNLHCYLCDVKVGPKVKHCGVCNKCVADFDHHCKWLNNCVGGRNYWCFFVALSSATLGVAVIIAVTLFIFIQHYLDPNRLRTAPQFDGVQRNGTWLMFLPLAPVQTTSAGLLILAFITVMLSFICMLLLGHLLGFHVYLFSQGIGTYDHVKLQRHREDRNRDAGAAFPNDAKNKNKDIENQEKTVDCETLSQSTSCKFDGKGPLSSQLSESICTELDNFNTTSERVNGFHYGTGYATEHTLERSPSINKNRKHRADEECRSDIRKSVDSIPRVQDPLGSSVMIPDETEEE